MIENHGDRNENEEPMDGAFHGIRVARLLPVRMRSVSDQAARRIAAYRNGHSRKQPRYSIASSLRAMSVPHPTVFHKATSMLAFRDLDS